MAAEAKRSGKTLVDEINEIYAEYGYYLDALDSFTLKGKDGLERIAYMMRQLRGGGKPFEDIKSVIDYSVPASAEAGFGELPASDVLKYILNDDFWIAIRPSGTEPKIKIYYSIKSKNYSAAEAKLEEIRRILKATLNLN